MIRTLLERRPLIVADESTAHLDRENQKSVENMLLSSESALVYIAHNYNREMMNRFDRVLELKNGRIVYDGKPQIFLINDTIPAICHGKVSTVTEVDDTETINR